MTKKEEILRVLAVTLRPILRDFSADLDDLEEIRLRTGQPLAVTQGGRSLFLAEDGRCCDASAAHLVTVEEIRETMNYVSSYSRYAFEDKIRQGFLTIQGGHRVGLAGRVVLEQGTGLSVVKTIAPITFLNLRIARQIRGCGEAVFPWLWERGARQGIQRDVGQGAQQEAEKEMRQKPSENILQDTLLVSPPGMGKTTLLRDLIRLLSLAGMTVGVVDERSELGACWQGIPQNDLGPRTDVLDGCPKAEGLLMLVRTMSPQVIAVDEVGGREDCQAVEYAMNCGCRILATVHGSNWEELRRRPILGQWLEEGRFGRYVFIEKESEGGSVRYGYRVCDRIGKVLWATEDRLGRKS